jgi:hypothetical protein
MNGKKVQQGDKITLDQADRLLIEMVNQLLGGKKW